MLTGYLLSYVIPHYQAELLQECWRASSTSFENSCNKVSYWSLRLFLFLLISEVYAEKSNPDVLEEEGFSYPPQSAGSSGGSTGGSSSGSTGGSSSGSSPLGTVVKAAADQFNFDGLNGKTYYIFHIFYHTLKWMCLICLGRVEMWKLF